MLILELTDTNIEFVNIHDEQSINCYAVCESMTFEMPDKNSTQFGDNSKSELTRIASQGESKESFAPVQPQVPLQNLNIKEVAVSAFGPISSFRKRDKDSIFFVTDLKIISITQSVQFCLGVSFFYDYIFINNSFCILKIKTF